MDSVLPKGVVKLVAVNEPAVITGLPPTVRLSSPSGALMLNVPVWVSDSLLVSEPSGRSSSSTVASPPRALAVRLVIITGSSAPSIVIVSVAVEVSPSPSVIV